jgi:DNA-binding SARP family transcriptional activator
MITDLVNAVAAERSPGTPVLHLFAGPYVTVRRRRLEIPEGSKRLLAFAALHTGMLDRRWTAGALWPLGNDSRASGNLRSALWRLRGNGLELMDVDKASIGLRDDVVVDVQVACDWASRIISGTHHLDDLGAVAWRFDELELLPGCYEEWALMERERIRQRMLHAFEWLSQHLIGQRRFAEAVEVAMAAVSVEPLRESATRALIEAHLAEGNWAEAYRAFRRYRTILREELGTEPTSELTRLVDGRRPGRSVPLTQAFHGSERRSGVPIMKKCS